MATGPPWTIKALLAWTTDYLHGKGIESPRLEAQLLLAHVLDCSKIDLLVRHDEEPTADQKTAYRELVKRRADHWPTAYLVGKREFYLLSFEVSPAVLIPRPDTETLVVETVNRLRSLPSPRLLDLGTGSGCVAVSVLHQVKAATGVAVDVSPDAGAVAGRNATAHGVADRLGVRVGDLFGAVLGERFDLIVSNPPYVTPAELAGLAPEVRDHEPKLALDGGPDGLNFYRRIAATANDHLSPGGAVLVEIGSTQADAVRGVFAAAGWAVGPTVTDRAGRPRVVVATSSSASPAG